MKLVNWCWFSLVVFVVYGFLVVVYSEIEEIKDEIVKDVCLVRLESRGKCEEGGECFW